MSVISYSFSSGFLFLMTICYWDACLSNTQWNESVEEASKSKITMIVSY